MTTQSTIATRLPAFDPANLRAVQTPTQTSALAKLQHVTPLLGRIGLGGIFAISALGKLANFAGTAAFMASKGFPAASAFLAGAIAFELCGALALFAGYKARWGATLLLAFLIPATLIFHNFWAYTDAEQQAQLTNFLKNVAIGGGLLTVLAHGAGPLSIDARK